MTSSGVRLYQPSHIIRRAHTARWACKTARGWPDVPEVKMIYPGRLGSPKIGRAGERFWNFCTSWLSNIRPSKPGSPNSGSQIMALGIVLPTSTLTSRSVKAMEHGIAIASNAARAKKQTGKSTVLPMRSITRSPARMPAWRSPVAAPKTACAIRA